MNNKDVMVDSLRKAWELYDDDMCATSFSIAATAGVSIVLSHLKKEQEAHEETKALLKERMAHQEGLEIRVGNAFRDKVDAEYTVRNLQREFDARQNYIEELEDMLERKLNEDKK